MNRWVYHFSDPLPPGGDRPRDLLGGKGESLRELTQAGWNVPPGFTISTAACRDYFHRDRVWPAGLADEVRDNLARLERETGRRLGRGAQPLLVSVRSGAAVSMPGMMDTLLNCGLTPELAGEVTDPAAFWNVYRQFVAAFSRVVAGLDDALANGEAGGAAPPQGDDRTAVFDLMQAFERRTGRAFPTDPWSVLEQSIAAVFESWHNARAVAYRRRHDLTGLAGTAVTVQAMFPAQVSGVLFTQDPQARDAGRIVIDASPGLGEAVVSGEVTPDHYSVDRADFSQIQSVPGRRSQIVAALHDAHDRPLDQPVLDRAEIAELCSLALRIEHHFGHPCDIEWSWAAGRFALLQARPIRGLDAAQAAETARCAEIARVRGLANGRRQMWVVHNLGETLAAPTPLTWGIVRRFMTGDGGFGRMYRDLGYRPSQRVRQEGFLELICGRIYADPDRLAEFFWDGLPLAYDLPAVAADPALLNSAPSRFDPDRATSRFLTTLPANLLAMWRTSGRIARQSSTAADDFEYGVLPSFQAYVTRKRAQDLSPLSDAELLAELEARELHVLHDFAPESLKPGFFGGLAFDRLLNRLVQLLGPEAGAALAQTLVGGLAGDTTFEQDAHLYRVARGAAALEEFLERYGHRCVGEMELARPRWREDRSDLEQMLRRLAAPTTPDPVQLHCANAEKRQAAAAQLSECLTAAGGSAFQEEIEQDAAAACRLLPWREAGKHYLMQGYELLRLVLEELARRWELGPRVYFLRREELRLWPTDRDRLEEEIARRRATWHALKKLDPPDVVCSDNLDDLGVARRFAAASELAGFAISSGVAAGTARIVFQPHAARELGSGYIIVCPSTDPAWTPLFFHARGLVVERGGVLSHGAIVARDFGIPAVVCADATRQIIDGDRVQVDGNTGRIIIERPPARE